MDGKVYCNTALIHNSQNPDLPVVPNVEHIVVNLDHSVLNASISRLEPPYSQVTSAVSV